MTNIQKPIKAATKSARPAETSGLDFDRATRRANITYLNPPSSVMRTLLDFSAADKRGFSLISVYLRSSAAYFQSALVAPAVIPAGVLRAQVCPVRWPFLFRERVAGFLPGVACARRASFRVRIRTAPRRSV